MDDQLTDHERERPRRGWFGRPSRVVAVALVAAGVAAAAVTGVYALRGGTPTSQGGATGVVPEPIAPRVTATIRLGGPPAAIAAGEEGVWVVLGPEDDEDGASCGGDAVEIDPRGDEAGRDVALSGSPNAVATGAGSVWVATTSCGRNGYGGLVARLDPESGRTASETAVGAHPVGIAVGVGGVWVTRDIDGESGEVVRIDPESDRVVARIPAEGRLRDVAVAAGRVWVLDTAEQGGSLIEIDPVANSVVGRTSRGAYALAAGAGSVWVGTWDGAQTVAARVDRAARAIPVRVAAFKPAAFDGTRLWFTGTEAGSEASALFRLNPLTGRIEGHTLLRTSPVAVALDRIRRAVWVANYEGSVTRVDLRAP